MLDCEQAPNREPVHRLHQCPPHVRRVLYRRAVLEKTILSNGNRHFGPTGNTGQSVPLLKVVPHIPAGLNQIFPST